MDFFKYHGTGNDFILIDNRDGSVLLSEEIISELCHRRFGIGADGLILLNPSKEFDFDMRYFNADGKEGTMCGNGGRCITAFARHLGLISKECTFNSIDGIHQAIILKEAKDTTYISLQMQNVSQHKLIDENIFMDTGSPHYVIFSDNVSQLDVINKGRSLRYNNKFDPDGTNVNFVEIRDNGIFVRTYERGVEDETLSCGTGVTASALAYGIEKGINKGSVEIKTRGGRLKVKFERKGNNFTNIWLEGPAQRVFKGKIKEGKSEVKS
ncbi:MAG: diaminopimelate epimerase [Bacteroidetes bacterium]|nr:MAG: diaminopimelate epimerase [Bacteroidota bacterium]